MSFDRPSDPENDVPDWLKGLEPEEDAADFQAESAEVPAWMEDDDAQRSRETSEGEVPDWLEKIREQEKSVDEDEEVEPPDTGSLSPEDKKDTADWLEKIRVQYARDTGQLELPEEYSDADTTGDYMERIQALKQKDQPSDAPSDDDNWLGDMMGEQPEEPDADDSGWGMSSEEISAAKTPSGIWEEDETLDKDDSAGPDWLTGLPTMDSERPSRASSGKTEEQEDDRPDWLQDKAPVAAPTQEDEPALTPSDEESPDWLGSISKETPTEPTKGASPISDAAAAEGVDEEFTDLPGESGEGSLPNWLENLKFSPDDSKPGIGAEDMSIEDYAGEDVSSMLFEAEDLPDWLSAEAPEAVEEDIPEPVTAPPPLPPAEGDEDIAPAELPSWLQAMRPIEAVTASISEEEERRAEPGEEERIGPLAGLSDVLPAEPHIVQFGSRSVPVTGFQLSPAQKQYTNILKSMVDAEAAVPPVARRQVALPQQVLRWTIALLLMMIVFIGTLADSDLFALPETGMPAEQSAVVSQIESLPQGSRVLLAFEYQPGFTGEMEVAAFAVINHLLMRGASLEVVSTQATGPDIADRFLSTKFNRYPQIAAGQYVNLGYISGGGAGLLNFAANPNAATNPTTAQNIRDFAMVLVITDDPDLARIWVEQVQPFLDPTNSGNGTPLIMVVSAQAEPLVYPFYQSNPRQVTGIISGIVGGAYYEHVVNQVAAEQGTAQDYWFAYNIALLIAVVLIGGISLINLGGAVLRKISKPRQRGAA